ncbi:ABC transporter substrate-binding protein [Streptomyces sp. DSM 44917]|uniref:ABC transporter substrate-binding protein n=1 Tax=Streptomyces boetiae TaxID=3075541 RepID=A0ABU2L833_9ACTN|nr:ABC transporter substrate-binding protein [Streptomyces sp. DSM 44917]MDT0307728.1 ABC transporter substrate-binding protein [Streptomyces sp. DSM 44917]
MRAARGAQWVAGAIVVALAASACGGGGGDDYESFVRVSSGEPQNPLIPTDTHEQYGGLVIQNLFAKLVDFTDEGELEYIAAESVEPNEDSTVWTIRLREGWTFHDGTDVTAQSYVDAWNWAANVTNEQTNAPWFVDIAGYEDVHPDEEGAAPTAETMSGLTAVDPLTIQVELNAPLSYFDYKLGYEAFTPLPESFFEDPEAFGENPIGNGPYEFTEWTHNERVVLTRYEDYAGADAAQNDGVVFQHYNGLDTAYQDLVAGNIDVMDEIGPQDLPVYQDDLGDRAVAQDYNGIQTIVPAWYNWGGRPDPRVLQGISLAIDRETITRTVLHDSARPADSFAPNGVFGYQEGIGDEFTQYDPERARDLVEAGGGVPNDHLMIQYNADGPHQEWVEAVCGNIRENLDIECTADVMTDFQADLNARDANEVQSMYRGGWLQDYPLNVNFMRDLYQSDAAANYGRFTNEEVDRLFAEGDAAPTLEETVAAYQEAEEVLWQEMPAIPLWFQNVNGGFSERVENVRFTTNGQPVLTEITVTG